MKAGTLEIDLLANMARLAGDMQTAKGTVAGAMGDIERTVGRARAALQALGLTVGVGYLLHLAKGSIDAMDRLNDLSKTTSLAVETLAGLGVAAKKSGGDLDGIAASINKLSVNMGKDAEKFRALGVTAKDPLEAFKQLADVFVAIKDPQLRAAVGAEALGKSWASAAPLLMEGGAAIGVMVTEGAKLSGVTAANAKAADEFNDKWTELVGTGSLLTSLLGPVLPLLTEIAGAMVEARKESGVLDSTFKPLLETGKAIAVVFGNVSFVLTAMGTELGGIAAQFAAMLSGDFTRVAAIGSMMEVDAIKARQAFDAWEKRILAVGTAATVAAPGLAGLTEANKAAAAAGAKFVAGADKQAKVMKDLGLASEHVAAWLKHLADEEARALALMEHRTKLLREQQQAEVDEINARDEVLDRLEDGNAQLRAEAELVGATGLARDLYILKLEKERDLKVALEPADRARIQALYAEKEALLRVVDARQQSVQVWDELSSRGASFFVDLAFNGAKAFDNLRASVKDLAKEMLALFAKRWILQMGASMAGGAAGESMAGQAAGVWNNGSMAGSLLTAGAGVYSGFTGASALAAAEAAGALTTTAAVGVAAPVGGSITAVGVGSSVYTALAAIPVWGWIAMAVIGAIAYFAGQGGGPKIEGEGGAVFSATGARVGATSGYDLITGTGLDGRMEQAGTALGDAFFEVLGRWGGTIGDTIAFHFAAALDDQGDASNIFRTAVAVAGQDVYSHNADGGRPEDFDGQIALETKRMLLAALQAADLPDAIAAILAPLDAVAATAEQIDAAFAAAEAMSQIIGVLAALDIPGMDIAALQSFQRAGETLEATLGRVAGLWATYQDQFLTDAEKLGLVQGTVSATFAELGLAVPGSLEEFKAIVNGLDLTTEAGRATWEALMEVAPAFATVANAATQAAAAAEAAAGRMLGSFNSLMGQIRGQGFSDSVTRGQMNGALDSFGAQNSWTSGMSREGILAALRTITPEDFADYVRLKPESAQLILDILGWDHALASVGTSTVAATTGVTAFVDTLGDAAAAANKAAGIYAHAMQIGARITALNGDEDGQAYFKEQLRKIELGELMKEDPSGWLANLTKELWGLEDAADAAAEAARLEADAKKVASDRLGLQGRIIAAGGTVAGETAGTILAAQRAIELDAANPALRALMVELWGLEEAAAAAAEAAALQERIAGERYGLETRLLQLQGNTAELRARELEKLDPTNRALQEQIWALEDQASAADRATEAAQGVTAAMQETVAAMDQVASFRGSVGDSSQSIRASMAGFDPIGYQSGQVAKHRGALASAMDLQGRLEAGGKLRDSIMGRYQAETDAANELHQLQEDNARAAIDAANALNAALRAIGDYARELLVGELSTLSPAQKLKEAEAQYRALLGRAQGGDLEAMNGLQGAASTYLEQARGFYASSDAYVRIFGEVQGTLAALGARAGPDQVYQEDTAAWQAELAGIQQAALEDLGELADLTELWQQELQGQLDEQAIAFSNIDLSTSQIEFNTRDLDTRIAAAIAGAIKSAVIASGAIVGAAAQSIDGSTGKTVDAIEKIPVKIATAIAVTDRR